MVELWNPLKILFILADLIRLKISSVHNKIPCKVNQMPVNTACWRSITCLKTCLQKAVIGILNVKWGCRSLFDSWL